MPNGSITGTTTDIGNVVHASGSMFPSWFVVLFLLLAAGLVVYFATRKE